MESSMRFSGDNANELPRCTLVGASDGSSSLTCAIASFSSVTSFVWSEASLLFLLLCPYFASLLRLPILGLPRPELCEPCATEESMPLVMGCSKGSDLTMADIVNTSKDVQSEKREV